MIDRRRGGSPSARGAAASACASPLAPGSLVTERLTLERLSPLDLPALWDLHSDPRAFELDSTEVLTRVDQMRHVLTQWLAAWGRDGIGYRTVRLRDAVARPVIGVCGATVMQLNGRPVLSIYYRFSPAHWNRGFATEALSAVLADAHHSADLPDEIVIVTDRGNAPSLALARRLGFTPTDERDADEDPSADLVILRRSRTAHLEDLP